MDDVQKMIGEQSELVTRFHDEVDKLGSGSQMARVIARANAGQAVPLKEWHAALDAYEAALERADRLWSQLDDGVRAIVPSELARSLIVGGRARLAGWRAEVAEGERLAARHIAQARGKGRN